MAKNKLKWLDTEYCGTADTTIQPVLVNNTILYTLYDNKGFNYVFTTIYTIHLHWSGYVNQYELPGTYAPIADFALVRGAAEACERFGYNYMVGNVLSSDTFYSDNPQNDKWMKMGVLAVEMEIAALYMNAARAGKRALGILTISDHILTGEVTTAEERQNTFTKMMDVAFSLV